MRHFALSFFLVLLISFSATSQEKLTDWSARRLAKENTPPLFSRSENDVIRETIRELENRGFRPVTVSELSQEPSVGLKFTNTDAVFNAYLKYIRFLLLDSKRRDALAQRVEEQGRQIGSNVPSLVKKVFAFCEAVGEETPIGIDELRSKHSPTVPEKIDTAVEEAFRRVVIQERPMTAPQIAVAFQAAPPPQKANGLSTVDFVLAALDMPAKAIDPLFLKIRNEISRGERPPVSFSEILLLGETRSLNGLDGEARQIGLIYWIGPPQGRLPTGEEVRRLADLSSANKFAEKFKAELLFAWAMWRREGKLSRSDEIALVENITKHFNESTELKTVGVALQNFFASTSPLYRARPPVVDNVFKDQAAGPTERVEKEEPGQKERTTPTRSLRGASTKYRKPRG